MNILIIGSGGREHALVWKIRQSPLVKKIYAIPGNAGIEEIAQCVDIGIDDFSKISDFVKKEKIDLTVVGPELPLVGGIVDHFQKEGLKIFGPTKNAARLEGSKVFAKELMKKYKIPTGAFEVFAQSDKAREYIEQFAKTHTGEAFCIVVKADGLAAGKGVMVCKKKEDALEAIKNIMDERAFADAGKSIVIEEFLRGEEASILAFCDGKTILPMISSQDHKQVFDGDRGPNTGGMGAYAPAPLVTDELMGKITRKILEPLKKGLEQEGIKYQGIIYVGVMVKNGEPYVLEFNARFGDPETQPVLMLLESDLVPVLDAVVNEDLHSITLKWYNKSSICVALVSGGYPGKYEKSIAIYGLEDAALLKDVMVFHAGTRKATAVVANVLPLEEITEFLTAGGRVLGVTATADTLKEAIDVTYNAIEAITFKRMYFRKDIGKKGLKHISDK
ncbi:MAG: phosphoribosylamine--glycine ligase [bacterium]